MQISDFMNQYYNNVSAGSTVSNGTEGIRQISSTIQNLVQGQIFEASILQMDGDQVTIGLSNGQNISARLGGDMELSVGQSIFFEVKSNSGNTVEISPLSNQPQNNPVLLSALDAASLPLTEKNLTMVDLMMKSEMPIDVNSLHEMAKEIASNPDSSVSTILTMNRLNLPTSPEMVSQFENYVSNENEILESFSELSSSISSALESGSMTSREAISLEIQIYETITGEKVPEGIAVTDETSVISSEEEIERVVQEDVSKEEVPSNNVIENNDSFVKNLTFSQSKFDTVDETNQKYESLKIFPQTIEENVSSTRETITKETSQDSPAPDSIAYALKGQSLKELSNDLLNLPGFKEQNPQYFDEENNLKGEQNSKDLLKDILSYISSNSDVLKDKTNLMEKNSFQALRKNLLEQTFTIKPEELKNKENPIKELYQKMTEKLNQVDQILEKNLGQDNPASKTIHNVEDNVRFMDQINQNYAYVQIPLQMSSQNATGELYIYKNHRRKGGEDDGTVTAFLHFDLEHLGSTDISVKMKDKKVDTRFFMEDDASYNLVEEHLPELDKRIRALGYDCHLVMEKDGEKPNFITSMIEKDAPVGGNLQRYSFDMKA